MLFSWLLYVLIHLLDFRYITSGASLTDHLTYCLRSYLISTQLFLLSTLNHVVLNIEFFWDLLYTLLTCYTLLILLLILCVQKCQNGIIAYLCDYDNF